GDDSRQFVVLDRIANPARVVSGTEVMQPGGVIDAFGDLHEHVEIVCAKVEGARRSAEVEALVLAQSPFGVFADVPFAFTARLDGGNERLAFSVLAAPENRRTRLSQLRCLRRLDPDGPAEAR